MLAFYTKSKLIHTKGSTILQLLDRCYLSSQQLPQNNAEAKYISLGVIWFVLYNLCNKMQFRLKKSNDLDRSFIMLEKRNLLAFLCKQIQFWLTKKITSGAIHRYVPVSAVITPDSDLTRATPKSATLIS
jgi:hypothetical protein